MNRLDPMDPALPGPGRRRDLAILCASGFVRSVAIGAVGVLLGI